MENSSAFQSSPLCFTSSCHTSNGSIDYSMTYETSGSEVDSTIAIGKFKASNNFKQLLSDASSKFSDAVIVVEGISVGVQQCILAARSRFFQELFRKQNGNSGKEGKPRYCMTDISPFKVGYEAFLTFLSYLKCGKLKHFPPEVSTCVDTRCAHDSCRPPISFAVELMYASSVFQVPELASLIQRHLLIFVEKALVENVIPILVVAFHCQSSQLLSHCVDRVARSDLQSICIEKEVPFEVTENIKMLRQKFLANKTKILPINLFHERTITRIYKALDSDDVELVKLLLNESNISLDEAFALHYAVAYCSPKVVTEVLELDMADVNLRNTRGYTVLHIAAMRKEPLMIISLLTKGAHAFELTLDGQSAVCICKRFTKPKDYHAKTEHCQEANKDRICIDVLEREMHRNTMAGDHILISFPLQNDDPRMKLLELETKVALVRLLFPLEAKLAMEIANLDSSSYLMKVDLNETPIVQSQRLLSKMQVLSKTVELGEHYFPHCFQVLDKLIEDRYESNSEEEQMIYMRRFVELKDDIEKAYNRDRFVELKDDIEKAYNRVVDLNLNLGFGS